MAFANVNIGTNPADGTGDPLRTAFQKINQNFANIATTGNPGPVTRINGRQGDVTLTANDIVGTVTRGYVDGADIAGNVYVDQRLARLEGNVNANVVANVASSISNQANILLQSGSALQPVNANVTAANAAIAGLQSTVSSLSGTVDSITSGLGTATTNIATLTSNAALQASQIIGANAAIITANSAVVQFVLAQNTLLQSGITGANAAIVTANTAMKGYVDAVSTAWTANAGIQAGQIASLTANIGVVNLTYANVAIADLQSNAGVQAGNIAYLTGQVDAINTNLTTFENINLGNQSNVTLLQSGATATNVAIVTANTAIKNYVDAVTTAWTANAGTQASTLTTLTANAASQSADIIILYANAGVQANSLLGANAAIVTANTAMKAYVDTINSTLTANAGTQATSIASISNSISNINSDLVIFETAVINNNANVANVQVGITLANASIATLTANAGVQANQILAINANVTAANAAIIAANLYQTNSLTNFSTYANTNFLTTSYTNSNVAIYLPTYTGNVSAGNIKSDRYLFSNGVNILSTVAGLYSNANVTSYLPTHSGDVSANTIRFTGNIYGGNFNTSLHQIKGNILFGNGTVGASTDSIITINLNAAAPLVGANNTVHLSGADNTPTYYGVDAFGSNVASGIFGRKARGTSASPSAVQAGDDIVTFAGKGYGAAAFSNSAVGATSVSIVAAENYTQTNQGTEIHLHIIKLGANVVDPTSPQVKFTANTTTINSGNPAGNALVINGGLVSGTNLFYYGNITSPGGNISIGGNVTSNDFRFANGVSILSTVNGGSTPSRTTVVASSGSIAAGASANVVVTGFKGYALYSVQTTANAWVTIYTSNAAASSDYSRSISTDPTPGSGVIAEAIVNGTTYFTPAVTGFNAEAPVTNSIPIKIYNNSGSTATIGVTLTLLKLEN